MAAVPVAVVGVPSVSRRSSQYEGRASVRLGRGMLDCCRLISP